jgi:hypothetical protein
VTADLRAFVLEFLRGCDASSKGSAEQQEYAYLAKLAEKATNGEAASKDALQG